MFIYCNGDSFTEGSGLANHLVYDDYPGKVGFIPRSTPQNVKMNKMKQWYEYTNKSLRKISWDEQNKEQYDRAWPKKLGELLNVTVLNRAVGGSAQYAVLYRLTVDLMRLTEQGRIPDYVILQITGPGRIPVFRARGEHLIQSVSHWENDGVVELEQLVKWHSIVEPLSDWPGILRWMFDLATLNQTVKSITGKYPILVDSCWLQSINETQIRLIGSYLDDFELVREQSRIDTITPDLVEENYFEGEDLLPCGHYPQSVVNRFAAGVANYLRGIDANLR